MFFSKSVKKDDAIGMVHEIINNLDAYLRDQLAHAGEPSAAVSAIKVIQRTLGRYYVALRAEKISKGTEHHNSTQYLDTALTDMSAYLTKQSGIETQGTQQLRQIFTQLACVAATLDTTTPSSGATSTESSSEVSAPSFAGPSSSSGS